MSADSDTLHINPTDIQLTLGTNQTVSLKAFVDDVQCIPSFPPTLQVYDRSLASVPRPSCGVCNQPMTELFKTRDNGWSCSGLSQPDGCLSGCDNKESEVRALLAAGKYDQKRWPRHANVGNLGNCFNTAGWNRWRCSECDFDYCTLCSERSLLSFKEYHAKSAKSGDRLWRYQIPASRKAPSPTQALPAVKTLDIHKVVQCTFPLFCVLSEDMNIELFFN